MGLQTTAKADDRELSKMVVALQAGVLALVSAVIGGLGLFLMTVWLVIKGGPRVGQHLSLISQYLVGYSVTWKGSIVGLFYGALIGGIVGWMVAKIYNWVARLRHN
jgi:hypothetical protein